MLQREMAKQTKALSRSEQMARVRSKDTKPELLVRRGLHSRGYRFRLHQRRLPGTPDIVLKKYKAVVEVRGCFWHGHEGCGRRPKSRLEFWNSKIDRTRERDKANECALAKAGWRVLIVWECCIVGKGRWSAEALLDAIEEWLASGRRRGEIEGH